MSTPEGQESPFQEPDHPDYETLTRVALEAIDAPAQQVGFDLTSHIEQVVDHKSAAFVAITRALSFLEIPGPNELHSRMDEVMKTALFWLDGFYIGARFEQTRVTEDAEEER